MKTVTYGNFTSVNDIFTTPNYLFIVPSFQRPYAWDNRHFQDLLDDLDMASKPNRRHHYLSPIHIIKIKSKEDNHWKNYVDHENIDIKDIATKSKGEFYDDDDETLTIYFVIDGQQRLTSLFTLFYQIHKTKPFSNLFVKINGNQIPRLILNPPNDHYKFKQLLGLSSPSPTYESRAQKRLEKAFEEANTINSKSIKFIRGHGLELLIVEIDPDHGLQTFQTQNDRGKPLTNLERLKSLLMEYELNYCTNQNLSKEINQIFGKLYKVLDKSIEVGLFREGEDGDNELIQLLSTYLRIENEPDTYWHGAEKIYKEYFREELKSEATNQENSNNNQVFHKLNIWLTTINEIVEQLDHLNDYIAGNSNLTTNQTSSIDSSRTIGDDYQIVLKSLKLNVRNLALLLKFRAKFQIEWHERVKIPTITLDNSDITQVLQDKLKIIEGKLPKYIPQEIKDKVTENDKKVQNIESKNVTEISPLEVIEKNELLIFKLWDPKGNFSNCWRSSFNCPNPNISDALVKWYNCFWHKPTFIQEVLHNSGKEGIYKYILREYESYYFGKIIHFNDNLQFEHIFPQKANNYPPVSFGFSTEREYQQFIEKIENRNFLDGKLNDLISSDLPDKKTQPYISQSYATQKGPYSVISDNQIQSIINIGKDFSVINMDYPSYHIYLELRCLELCLFVMERFF